MLDRANQAPSGSSGPSSEAIAKALIEAGAPVNGHPGDKETPLITAASSGEAEVARALIDAGADLEAVSAPDSGGVPTGTALKHAAVFGMTDVLDILVAAGAKIHDLEMAAAAGDSLAGHLTGLTLLREALTILLFSAPTTYIVNCEGLSSSGRHRNAAPAYYTYVG